MKRPRDIDSANQGAARSASLGARIRATEVWQRLIARKHKAKFMSWLIVAAGVLIVVQVLHDERSPVPELEQLDRNTGTLVAVGVSGKGRNEYWFSLRLPTGELTTYRSFFPTTSKLKGMEGRPFTVWSQQKLVLIKFGYVAYAKQIQSENGLIEEYSKAAQVAHFANVRKSGMYLLPTRILPALLIAFGLFVLWHVNRR